MLNWIIRVNNKKILRREEMYQIELQAVGGREGRERGGEDGEGRDNTVFLNILENVKREIIKP